MALKNPTNWGADRFGSEISYFLNAEAEAGIVVIAPTGEVPSPGLDSVDGVFMNVGLDVSEDPIARVPSSNAGKPLGILLKTMVDVDPTKYLLVDSQEVYMGRKVEILRNGWIETDMLDTGSDPVNGDAAYFIAGGLLSTTSGSVRVGTFESSKDANGFIRVRVQL